ncbi:hypothetical protein L228DRAFT_58852 [Xylona heveae TC161]|uniref:DUF7770 domain-containing protein n=1 Tax=Xylona heveae (strain CBS 132557 / TC161) TaxID=1328760 RepID=A0A165IIM8_XYLHT|nr:hypothetical protein L228DRAFT_58852 [Xylona heveae TC161]KZF24946.1 hypothetical protein L228DRAFT_58852 [Xylona heveae TC161]
MMSTVRYIPPSIAAGAANKSIICIYACAYSATPVSGPGSSTSGTQTNHWVLFCCVNQRDSYRIDPSPSGPNLTITPIITFKGYPYTANASKICQLDTSSLTVGSFIALLERSTYDKYQFDAGGQGCRYWIYSVVNLLQSQGHIQNSSQTQAAINALGIVWGDNHQPLPTSQQTGITPGRFYALS